MIAVIHSFGTDVTTPGGTDQIDGYYETGIAAGAIVAMDTAERSAQIRENRMILLMRLGAVLSRSGGAVNYWRITISQFNYEKTITPFIVEFPSGFV